MLAMVPLFLMKGGEPRRLSLPPTPPPPGENEARAWYPERKVGDDGADIPMSFEGNDVGTIRYREPERPSAPTSDVPATEGVAGKPPRAKTIRGVRFADEEPTSEGDDALGSVRFRKEGDVASLAPGVRFADEPEPPEPAASDADDEDDDEEEEDDAGARDVASALDSAFGGGEPAATRSTSNGRSGAPEVEVEMEPAEPPPRVRAPKAKPKPARPKAEAPVAPVAPAAPAAPAAPVAAAAATAAGKRAPKAPPPRDDAPPAPPAPAKRPERAAPVKKQAAAKAAAPPAPTARRAPEPPPQAVEKPAPKKEERPAAKAQEKPAPRSKPPAPKEPAPAEVAPPAKAGRTPEPVASASTVSGVADPLYAAAVNAALERGSTSLVHLKRALDIGYARASSLLESLVADGILGEMTASGSRPTLVTPEQWAKRSAGPSKRRS
jgi:hypothetical protein